ncbi:MAG: hypothetical protein AAGG44_18115, partial [Planctomycetota bacterium]
LVTSGAFRNSSRTALNRETSPSASFTRFNAVRDEFLKAPEVTKQRIYVETMLEVVPKLGKKIILDDQARQILPMLQLSPESGSND